MICFQIVGRAEAALAALHVDDGAERALVGAAAAEIDARIVCPTVRCDVLARQDRRRLAAQRRQVVHEIVERLAACRRQASRSTSSSRCSSASPAKSEMPSACASLMSAGISGSIEMQPETWKPPMQTWQAGRAERPREIDRARELVRLHADQPDQRRARPRAADHADDAARDARGGWSRHRCAGGCRRRGPAPRARARPRPGRSGRPACWRGSPSATTGSDSRRRRSGSA